MWAITFPEKFTWPPNQLMVMIREIGKVCSEEGLSDVDQQADGTRVARFFSVQYTKTGKNIPIVNTISKWPYVKYIKVP
jgi:hypothetical protein